MKVILNRKKNNGKFALIDKITLIVGIIIPLMTIPQIIKIWMYKNASGVSLFSWCAYFILTIPLLIYSIMHKQKPLIIMYTLWLMVHVSVSVGVIIYG